MTDAPIWRQAMKDRELSPTTRIVMWYMQDRLAVHEYREVYTLSLASEVGVEPQTLGRCLRSLVESGYLLERGRRPRSYRLVWSRGDPA